MRILSLSSVILFSFPFFSFPQSDSSHSPAKPLIYNLVEQHPEYPGGDFELTKFLRAHSKYPTPDIKDHTTPRRKVLVRFVVEADGNVDEVEVTKSLTPELDAEAVRLVKLLPPFIPGRQQGKPVRVYFNLPVTFL